MSEFIRLKVNDGTWDDFVDDWRRQCEKYDEDFEYYEEGPLSYVKDLAEEEHKKAAVYALKDDDGVYVAMCQLNTAKLPKTVGTTLRVRMMYMSPDFDFGDYDLTAYAVVLAKMLTHIHFVSNSEMRSEHIKFHLRSPADRQFFTVYGELLNGHELFESVRIVGTWLHITK